MSWVRTRGFAVTELCNRAHDAEVGVKDYREQPQRNRDAQLEAVAAGGVRSSLCGHSLKEEAEVAQASCCNPF